MLALALAGALAWHALSGNEPAASKAVAQGPVTVAAPPALPTPASAGPAASAAATVPAPAPSTAPASSTPAAPAATHRAAASPPAPARERRVHKPAPARAPEPAAESERLYASQRELPEAIRRELPRIAVGGASYSKDPASRMVILNGQVFHEGDKVAPGLVLQTIKLKSAVLEFKGYRYELSY